MAGFFNAVSACLVLLLLMSVGYGMGILGWMTSAEKRFISKYIVNIAVPCNCIVGLLNNLDHGSLIQAAGMVGAGLLGVAASMLTREIPRLPGVRSSRLVAGSQWER